MAFCFHSVMMSDTISDRSGIFYLDLTGLRFGNSLVFGPGSDGRTLCASCQWTSMGGDSLTPYEIGLWCENSSASRSDWVNRPNGNPASLRRTSGCLNIPHLVVSLNNPRGFSSATIRGESWPLCEIGLENSSSARSDWINRPNGYPASRRIINLLKKNNYYRKLAEVVLLTGYIYDIPFYNITRKNETFHFNSKFSIFLSNLKSLLKKLLQQI